MQPETIAALSPLFQAANPKTLEWLLPTAIEHEYPGNRAVLMEDSWGNAVYFILSGWVKVRRLAGDSAVTIAVLGKGDVFGEMAILDESPRSTDVVSLSPVQVLSISAPNFIQTLLTDPQLQYRMLQMMGQRLKQMNGRFQLQNQPSFIRLASTLVDLGDKYGVEYQETIEIFNVPFTDLANISDINVEDAAKIMGKFRERGWIKIDSERHVIKLSGIQQLRRLLER
ncbi:MAG: Crp/Fnr family transcriptional regulator [Synechococcales cyanobacterium RM1_1_8]|nr:Crp/Fnr family transcriptional regulator [Synechococcales cyanobacterium RM1_1_8]